MGRFKEAKQILLQATKLRRHAQDNVWRSLGLVCEELSEFEDAKTYLNKYIALTKNFKDAAIIRTHVETIENVIKANGSKQSADYLDTMTPADVTPWISSKTNLTIYIAPGNGIPGYKESYRQDFQRAVQAWNQALDGKLVLALTDTKDGADIEVKWHNQPPAKASEGGETIPWVNNHEMGHAQITIFTTQSVGTIAENDIYQMELHEMGHALGLGGHSSQPQDVMYPSHDQALTAASELSARDIATIRRLYSSRPDKQGQDNK